MTGAAANSVVADCAEQRAQAAASADRPPTIPEAIELARWLRRTPDAIVSRERLRQIADVLFSAIEATPCFHKAMVNGEEVFVLRQRDRAAVEAIFTWAHQAKLHGCRDEKISEALSKAQRWAGQPDAITRWPD